MQGIYHAAQRPLLDRYTPLETATYAMVAGTAMLLPTLPWTLPSVGAISARSWIATAALAVGPSALGFVTWAAAVGRMQVSRPALALYAVPVVAIGVSWVWLGERPRVLTVVAGGVALIGVAVGTLGRRAAPAPNAARSTLLDEPLDVGLVLVALPQQPDPQELGQ
ncbi:MAG: family transporter [Ilumatobacteraceae bacterium]|nr:family transporter [Ilumatobacteraceae bacterium]